MKKQIKRLLVASLCAFAFTTGAFGVATWSSVSADVITNENVAMVDGASLRLEDEDLNIKFGLRFKTEINKEWYDSLTNPQVYTLLLPTDKLNDSELTADSENAIKTDVDENKKYVVGDNYRFNVVLTDIPETAYSMAISARSYVVTEDNTYYAKNTVSRSVVYVANGAIELDIENNENKYEAVEKYLIDGVSIADTGFEITGTSRSLKASVSYRNGVSETVQKYLNKKYKMSYSVESTNADASFDDAGKFSVTNEGTTTVKATFGEFASATATVTSYIPTYGQLFNFDAIDTTQLENYNNPVDLKAVSYNGKQVISFEHHSAGKQENNGFYAYTPTWFREKKFDTATITVRLNEESGDTNMNWLFLGNNNWSLYNGNSNYQLSNAGDEKQFTTDFSNTSFYKETANGTKGCAIYVKARQAWVANATFYITNVSFGINDIESDGTAVNLYDKFHTDSKSATFTFTPNGGTAQTISNPAEFVASKSGKITATITAEGYKTGTVKAKYTCPTDPVLVDFSEPIDVSGMTLRNTATNLRLVEYNGGYAIAFDFEHAENEVGSHEYFGIKMTKPTWISDYSTVTITATLLNETGTNASAATYIFYNNVENYEILDSVNSIKTIVVSTSNDEFIKNGVINIWWRLRDNTHVVSGTIIITNIEFSN